MVVIVKEVVFVEISLYFYGCIPFHCKFIVLALYLDSLHCSAVASMAFNASVVMSQQTLEYWRQIWDIVPCGGYFIAEAHHCMEEYVNKVYQLILTCSSVWCGIRVLPAL